MSSPIIAWLPLDKLKFVTRIIKCQGTKKFLEPEFGFLMFVKSLEVRGLPFVRSEDNLTDETSFIGVHLILSPFDICLLV